MKNRLLIATLLIFYVIILSSGIMTIGCSKDTGSIDDKIIRKFSVAGVKLGMGENEAAKELQQFAKKVGGILYGRCVIQRNRIVYLCVGLSNNKISSIRFHASFAKIPYNAYGMDVTAAKIFLKDKYNIKLDNNNSYKGDKLMVTLHTQYITFKLK